MFKKMAIAGDRFIVDPLPMAAIVLIANPVMSFHSHSTPAGECRISRSTNDPLSILFNL